MAFVPKMLAAGKLGTALATLYEVESPKVAARITKIILANTSTANNYAGTLKIQPASLGTTNAYYAMGAGTLILAGGSIELYDSGGGLMLSQGDLIQGNADTADVVDYIISGGDE